MDILSGALRLHEFHNRARLIVDDRLRCTSTHFKPGAHFLDLPGLLFRRCGESASFFFRSSHSKISAILRAFMQSPEELAREKIDKLLADCGWIIQNRSTINLSAGRGIAIREGLLKGGEADYLLFGDGKALGTVEAKPEGYTLTGVEEQSGKYATSLLDIYPKWGEPLAFAYESTGIESAQLPLNRYTFARLAFGGPCQMRGSSLLTQARPALVDTR
jgi:hypothetical protein